MSIEKLRELTDKLPSLGDLVIDSNQSITTYTTDKSEGSGTCLGVCLHHEPNIAVQRVFMSKNSRFPQHYHKEWEYGVVYKGKIKTIVDGKEKILSVGDCMSFTPDQPHSVITIEDSWMIFVTVPAGEGYPDGKS